MWIWGVISILFEKTWPVSSIFGLGQPTNIGCGGGGLRANYGVLAKWVSYNWADYDLTSALCGFPNYPICQLYICMDLKRYMYFRRNWKKKWFICVSKRLRYILKYFFVLLKLVKQQKSVTASPRCFWKLPFLFVFFYLLLFLLFFTLFIFPSI